MIKRKYAMIQEVHRIITGDPEEVENVRNTRTMCKSIGDYQEQSRELEEKK